VIACVHFLVYVRLPSLCNTHNSVDRMCSVQRISKRTIYSGYNAKYFSINAATYIDLRLLNITLYNKHFSKEI